MSRLEQLLADSIALIDAKRMQFRSEHITVTEARQMLIRMASAARRGDINQAALVETQLSRAALKAVAGGAKDAKQIAAIALSTDEVLFDRAEV